MATAREEEAEQNFFLGKVKEQEQDERKHKMTEKTADPKAETRPGYSGSDLEAEEPFKRPEGKKFERPKDASKDAVVSDVGATEPTVELGGDGITPKAEWDKKYEAISKKHAEHDEKMRARAVEDAGVIQTTEKGKNG